eukprot:TRINITY_DN5549_c0_g2_i4.p1 TRINITY_DN5549_c0_g2~~TRINITY_DN5549_c0_g2_i4.p1  ORF type:complete len:506 (+),score=139.51 TRINITY_DN5549_c0_g2_i4:92-1609(+)
MAVSKYHFVNGVMQMNPAYQQQQAAQGTPAANTAPPQALAVVASMDDANHANALHMEAHGAPMQFAPSTQASVDIMQRDEYLQRFQSPSGFQAGEVLDQLTARFARYEIPLGMLNKLCMLSEYSLNLIVDDSGSMNNVTDSNTDELGDYMRQRVGGAARATAPPQGRQLTRWQEAQDRVHTILDLLTYVPTGDIEVGFLNRQDRVHLTRRGNTPEQFAADAHSQVAAAFRQPPSGQTPTKRALLAAFQQARGNTMHYLLTDGEPSDAMERVDTDEDGKSFRRYPEIEQIVMHRRNPRGNPITFVSCTGDDAEAEWMKVLEEEAPYAAEIDDFAAEAREVHNNQGPHFPFTRGFWLLCLLAAAVNPDDLDAMDEHAPFSKMTMDNLLGRVLTEQDYTHYFRAHPQEPVVRRHYQEFATARATGKQIWQRHGLRPVQRQPAPAGALAGWGTPAAYRPPSFAGAPGGSSAYTAAPWGATYPAPSAPLMPGRAPSGYTAPPPGGYGGRY